MLELGRTHTLEVVKQVTFGFYLDGKNLGEVLLPNRVAPKDTKIGSTPSLALKCAFNLALSSVRSLRVIKRQKHQCALNSTYHSVRSLHVIK